MARIKFHAIAILMESAEGAEEKWVFGSAKGLAAFIKRLRKERVICLGEEIQTLCGLRTPVFFPSESEEPGSHKPEGKEMAKELLQRFKGRISFCPVCGRAIENENVFIDMD